MTTLPIRIPLPDEFYASLRPLGPNDVDAWSAYLSEPGVIEHTSWGDVGPSNLEKLVADYAEGRDSLRWAIVDSSDSLLGTVGLNEISREHGRAEIAYDLDPRHCGRGLATEAASAVILWAHTVLGLQRVQATVLDSNILSIAVLERVGMQREGLIRQYRRVRGQARDYWMYSAINHTGN
ncbi:GNAT family N-acetyltransferase [Serratia proteamaculans]|uniref:GNAT family N-acetyltransferase n=1 Tax=Serratia proteamaculans TaxID=28151 RepID=A0A7U0RM09_SERPR|nr:GNAT family protein [Serratia proteamaculans]MBO1505243.1 GNAT family N-acetyltransferase [Serratia proteamaculans]MDW5511731.1 GNAT family protein [Serratia proteamaculans]QQX51827.1 GNAT family N-acetyltransferase [Serratia proteamaculans]CAI1919924.1 Spermidine N(1)-acetyltransferase [Serratia proteamaculans]